MVEVFEKVEIEETPLFEDMEIEEEPVFVDMDVAKRTREEEIFKVVEQMPRFSGCEGQFASQRETSDCAKEKMLQYIYKNLIYPEDAIKEDVEGTSVIQFVVAKDGSIKDASIIRDIGSGCGQEALRVVNEMNNLPRKWTPGLHRGHAVSVYYTLRVTYKLGDDGDQKQ